MISAAAYVLRVPENRHEILLRDEGGGWFSSEEPAAGEPVPRRFASLDDVSNFLLTPLFDA